MKKLGFLLVVFSFFGFLTFSSCNQAPKETEAIEEVAPEEDMTSEDMPTEEDVDEVVEEITE